MAIRGNRGGGGDRVLESRHVIGLFLLMLVFSGVFFALGYVMGRSQYDGQVRAASTPRNAGDTDVPDKTATSSKPASPSTGRPVARSAEREVAPSDSVSDWYSDSAQRPSNSGGRWTTEAP